MIKGRVRLIAICKNGCVAAACLLAACSTAIPVWHDGAKRSPETSTPSAAENGAPNNLMPQSLGDEIAIRAIALVGHPYRYGGADLDGFDCSGLVYFIHEQLGFSVPRTAVEQQQAAMAVKRSELEPGDLLFFHTRGRGVSHVGVYVGQSRFVHAPQSGRLIELRSLDDPYYGQRWVASGRLLPAS